MIASDIHGKFRHGCFCDYVERIELVTPEQELIAVGPDSKPDVLGAGMGMTGIVTEATLQLQPVETAYVTVDTEQATDLDDCMAHARP